MSSRRLSTLETNSSCALVSVSFSRYLSMSSELLLLRLVMTMSMILTLISVLGVVSPLSRSSVTSSSR